MTKREEGVLKILSGSNGWVTSAQLAAALGCSPRSIKSAVAGLNASYPGVIESSHSGFRMGDRAAAARASAARRNAIPQTAEERRYYVLRKLLIEQKSCDFDELAAELCISPVTLNNELPRLRTHLLDCDLTLRTRNNRLSLEGDEAAKKRTISRLIYDETKDFFSSMELINDYFPDLDMRVIRQTVDEVMVRSRLYLNDYSMSNLLLHIAITIERNLHGFATDAEEPCNRAVRIPAHIRRAVDSICAGLESAFSVRLNDSDRYTFSVILFTSCVNKNARAEENIIEPSVRGLVMQIRDKVYDAFDIELNDRDFMVRFGLHLKNMLIRFHGGVELRNPQLELIKTNYPYIYDIAVFIAGEIDQKTGVHISEDEIAYIALHIGGLIEQTNSERSKIHAVLLYPGYYEEGVKLMQRIYRTFQDSLLLENIISTPDALSGLSGCELLLSVVAPPRTVDVPVLQISNYLTSRDVTVIAAYIEKLKRRRLQDSMERQLKALFKPELFYYRPRFDTVEDVLETMGRALEEQGYAEPGFRQKLRAREHVSSSALGNLAIPHPLDMDARATAIAVAVYPEGIQWQDNLVNIVLMLAIRKEDRLLFRDIFEFVSGILLEAGPFQALMDATDLDTFIRVLLSGL